MGEDASDDTDPLGGDSASGDPIVARVERALGLVGLSDDLAHKLAPSDLQSLLLAVHRKRSARRTPANVLADYERDRFVRPADVEPARIQQFESRLHGLLPPEAEAIELSPVCPLGTSAVVGGVSQDWSLPTARNTEVVSDATNVLALECALQRRALLKQNAKSNQAVHLYTSHRLLRPQLRADPAMLAHFRLFHQCSAGRDQGNLAFESAAIVAHASAYLEALRQQLPSSAQLEFLLTDFHSNRRTQYLIERVLEPLEANCPFARIAFDDQRSAGRGYYRDLCFHINARQADGALVQLGDGGCVDWTQKFLGNAKERLVISAVSGERAVALG